MKSKLLAKFTLIGVDNDIILESGFFNSKFGSKLNIVFENDGYIEINSKSAMETVSRILNKYLNFDELEILSMGDNCELIDNNADHKNIELLGQLGIYTYIRNIINQYDDKKELWERFLEGLKSNRLILGVRYDLVKRLTVLLVKEEDMK